MVVAAMATIMIGLAACSGPDAGSARFTATPATALMDVPVVLTLTGAGSGDKVTVTARATDASGTTWRSRQIFASGPGGSVDFTRPPVSGSYTDADPLGVIDDMRPVTGSATTFRAPPQGYQVALTASVEGKTIASAALDRQTATATGVSARQFTVARDGFAGMLYTPTGITSASAPRPPVLLFGGSEGGESFDASASLLAAHGYPALSVAYFGAPGLPTALKDVPLEYFGKPLALLDRQPGADPKRLVVWGSSRGGELALLLGSTFPAQIHAVIAGSPSSTVHSAYPVPGAAWTLDGKPVPHTVSDTVTPDLDPQADIRVERISGPILTICGGQDQIWNSCDYAQAIAARRAAHGTGQQDTHRSYPLAGHLVGAALAYVPTTSTGAPDGTLYGGTVQTNAPAAAQAHQAVLNFLAGQEQAG